MLKWNIHGSKINAFNSSVFIEKLLYLQLSPTFFRVPKAPVLFWLFLTLSLRLFSENRTIRALEKKKKKEKVCHVCNFILKEPVQKNRTDYVSNWKRNHSKISGLFAPGNCGMSCLKVRFRALLTIKFVTFPYPTLNWSFQQHYFDYYTSVWPR